MIDRIVHFPFKGWPLLNGILQGLVFGFILSIFILSSKANAEIYTWTDSYGVINFTDDMDKVPSKYLLTPFVFTKDYKWTVDRSDTKTSNQVRLDYLRKFNVKEAVPAPSTTVIINNHYDRRPKRHRSHGR